MWTRVPIQSHAMRSTRRELEVELGLMRMPGMETAKEEAGKSCLRRRGDK
jgi:hypothetical protein